MNVPPAANEQVPGHAPQSLRRPLATIALLAGVVASGTLAACTANGGLPSGVSKTHISRTVEPRESIPGEPSLPAVNGTIWAGYVAPRQTADLYTSVRGSFTIQAIQCDATDPTVGQESYAQWVGLDGWNGDNTVEQIGITADCIDTSLTKGGKGEPAAPPKPGNVKPMYYAWWMNYGGGDYSHALDFPVHPGDKMDASVTYTGGDAFAMHLVNETTGQVYNKPSTCKNEKNGQPCQRAFADWVVERAGNSAMASFGIAGFDDATAATDGANNNQQTVAALNGFALDMFQYSKRLTHTSGLSADGKSFDVAYKQHGLAGQ